MVVPPVLGVVLLGAWLGMRASDSVHPAAVVLWIVGAALELLAIRAVVVGGRTTPRRAAGPLGSATSRREPGVRTSRATGREKRP